MSTLVMLGASGTKQISRENARDWIYTARAAS
jgi:precorrin-3B C17-methyltransferase